MAKLKDFIPVEIEERLSFEILLTEIASDFVNLPSEHIDAAIIKAQERICNHLSLDRSVLWQLIEDASGEMWLSHVHEVSDSYLPATPFDAGKTFPWILEQILLGNDVTIERVEDLPSEAHQDRQSLSQWGVKSSFIMPLAAEEKVVGALSFGKLSQETIWSKSVKQRLQLIAQIFANALSRKKAEKSLASLRRFENLVADISAQFVHLPVDSIDAEIEDAQQRICECLDVEVSSLWQWSNDDPPIFTITHLHSPPDGPAFSRGIDAQEALPWLFEMTQCGDILVLSTEDLPSEAARDRETRRDFGVTTSVIIPLSTGGGPIVGVLSFDSLQKKRIWTEPIIGQFELIGQLFANALARKHAENHLASLRRFEALVTDISTQFVNLPADLIDAEIEDAQRRICECIGVNLSSLWQWSEKAPHSLVLTHLHSPSYGPERPAHLDAKESFPWKLEQLMKGDVVAITTKDLPSEAKRDIESSRAFGIRSSAGIPLMTGGGPLIGVLSFEDLRVERSWPEAILNRLNMVAQIFANALARKRSDLRLREQLKKIEALRQRLENENIYLRKEVESQQVHGEIICRSAAMKKILAQVEQVARTEATVLIEGETGTGKELLARAIHRLSDRQRRPLITVNCAALPPTLMESELFGREKGAYTGALTRMTGRFEAAHGATLFLDETGELPIEVQAKLLRVLEQGCFERLGSTQVINVDVRIIAATNHNLANQVAIGKFRKDLFYRLNVFPIHLPPLRERPEDIPPLVWHFVRQYEEKMGRRIDKITQRSMADLQHYGWPGNIRELRNLVERAMISSNGRILDVRPPLEAVDQHSEPLTLKESERRLILGVLQQSGWRISGRSGAAEKLGLKRTTLQAKMKKLGIQRPSS
ncbi:GAF modulated two component system response regulator, sigma54-specific [Desulfosarcina variabilis str. Montpellier]|uniref:sigma 54-interacting transcriptional regulator n=1 Tax=Desulfosarcina variabilis TaxID=2300 RepID=UPI003AFB224F